MFRLLFKLILTFLVVVAGWRIGAAYVEHYQFREAIREATAANRSEAELRDAILEEAAKLEIPQEDEAVSVTLKDRHVVVSGEYVKPIALLPGFVRPWTFDWTVETFNAPPMGRSR